MNSRTLALIILDGFGISESREGNAVFHADTPNLDALFSNYPTTKLNASGLSVGLPDGQMGNSEVGHTNIGAGRVVYQDLTYINKCIESGSFDKNEILCRIIDGVRANDSRLHLMGLVSGGGVHSHINHLYALLKLAKSCGINKVHVHAWMDGRDTLPNSGIEYLKAAEEFMETHKIGRIDTISGRFYAMDRDNRRERTALAYQAIVHGKGSRFNSASEAILKSYSCGISDEFIVPAVREGYNGISCNDSVICFNFRPDRVRQITELFMKKNTENNSDNAVKAESLGCFTKYDKNTPDNSVIFKSRKIKNHLGEILSDYGLTQLRIAETEKYAHVTFFFNGGVEKSYKHEDRLIIASPKVKTYDLKPQMSAPEITREVIKNIKKMTYDFILVNFANPDMVGHTGDFEAAVKSVEITDKCVAEIVSEMNKTDGVTIITADHGNAEKMYDENKSPFTAHTSNPVPFTIIGYPCTLKNGGSLCDIAPTLLEIFKINKPREMTGQSLINDI